MTAGVHIFEKFNYLRHFVETGTHHGAGVFMALNSGFNSVYSIEIHKPSFKLSSQKFEHNESVKLYLGSSHDLLDRILSKLEEPALLWLDAHYSGEGTGGKGTSCTDVTLADLEILKADKLKDQNVILIDDMRDQDRKIIENYIKVFFPDHVIEYFFANNHEDDIMCIRN